MKCVAVAVVFAFWCSTAIAQVSPSDEPGRIEARFAKPHAALATGGRSISLPGTVAPEGAASVVIHVDAVHVAGATVFTEDAFSSLFTGLVGHEVPLASIYDLAQKLTAKYGTAGYVLSRAIVPPQELDPKHADITLQIVEGYVDRVEWPATAERYRDFFSDYAAHITAERPTNLNTVMRYLLLAGDLPGIDVTSRFEASKTNSNASTLVVEMTETPVDASAQIDNRGTEARGPWQYSAHGTFNNTVGLHEALTVGIAGTFDWSELHLVSLGYKQVVNSEGLLAFIDTSLSWGEPGTAALKALAFKSTSIAVDVGLAMPVIRSRDRNLTLSALVFASNNGGEMLGVPSSDDRLRGVRVKADFDVADEWNGVTQGTGTLSHGFEGLGSSVNGDLLASRANGRVDFTTLSASLSRQQTLGHGFSLVAAAEAQYAFTPLLSPEECGYGGRDFGRAFDPSELTGDTCWSVSGELRYDPDLPNNPLTTTELYAFADYGHIDRIAPSFGTPMSDAGSSAGVGLRLGTDNISADLSAVKPLFGRIDDGWRFFLTANAKY